MKKFLLLGSKNRSILSFLLFICVFPMNAFDFMVDGLCYNSIGNGEVEVTFLLGDELTFQGSYVEGDIKIPSYVEFEKNIYKVTKIGNSAFRGCSLLNSVIIPDTVVEIGTWAFGYTGLLSIIIPDSVETLGDYAFYECESLQSAEIGNSIKQIGKEVFFWCAELQSVKLGNSITEIGVQAFSQCYSLLSIDFPDSVVLIDDQAFQWCTSLSNITIGKNVERIGENAFELCTSLESVNISNSVKEIGNAAFGNCSIINLVIPDNVTFMGIYAFASNRKLESISIGKGIKEINDCVFSNCDSLTSLIVPDNVIKIGNGAFWYCDSLSSVILSENLTSIEEVAFHSCPSLKNIVIPDRVEKIGYAAFGGNELESVIIGKSVKEIYCNAFDCVYHDYNDYPGEVTCLAMEIPKLVPYEYDSYHEFCVYFRNFYTLYVYEDVLEDYKESEWAQYFKEILPIETNPNPGEEGAVNSINEEEAKIYNVYSLDGHKVMSTTNYSELEKLGKGIFIINDKKVIR